MPKDQLRPGDLQDLRVASRAARAGLLEQQRLALRPLVSPHGIYHGKLWQLEETHGKGCWELRKLCALLGAKACVAARGKPQGQTRVWQNKRQTRSSWSALKHQAAFCFCHTRSYLKKN